jgi:hypothetical protein
MNAHRDPDRLINAFLREGAELLDDRVYDDVRAAIEQERQRVVIGPWRLPEMNKLVPIGLGAAAVVVAVVIGTRLFGSPAPAGVGTAPTAQPSATPAPSTASPSAELPQDIIVTGADSPVQVTVSTTSSGWLHDPNLEFLAKNDDGLDPPQSVGAALLTWAWPAGTGFNVYGDPCQWSTTTPETPASTPAEIASAFTAQASTDATAPVDVTVGGFAGKAVTLHVPMSYEVPNATREEEFADCDQDVFGFYGIDRDTEPSRNAQGPGQVDELWILDVDGSTVILDVTYGPAASADLVDEMRTLAESATFEPRSP